MVSRLICLPYQSKTILGRFYPSPSRRDLKATIVDPGCMGAEFIKQLNSSILQLERQNMNTQLLIQYSNPLSKMSRPDLIWSLPMYGLTNRCCGQTEAGTWYLEGAWFKRDVSLPSIL